MQNKVKEQNSEADIPNFQVGFLQTLEKEKRLIEKDEHKKMTRVEN